MAFMEIHYMFIHIYIFIDIQGELNKQEIITRVALNSIESDKRLLIGPASEGE